MVNVVKFLYRFTDSDDRQLELELDMVISASCFDLVIFSSIVQI
jgi:hypothetical protein